MSTKINLRANNGLWVCAEGGGGGDVVANRPTPYSWEEFELINVQNPAQDPEYGQKVYLKACNGQYVCAENGGGIKLVANRQSPHEWETFVLMRPPGTSASSVVVAGKMTPIALRAWNGQYVCAEGGGGREVVANRNAIGPWETFSLIVAHTGVAMPVFPLTAVRDCEVTQGNHMHTWMSLSSQGQLSGSTHTWTDNTWQGVHAVSNVAFFDEHQTMLWSSQDCVCGVAGKIDPSGPHDRTCNFSGTVPGDVLKKIRGVAIIHRADPHSAFLDWFKTPLGTVIVVAAIVSVALTVVGELVPAPVE